MSSHISRARRPPQFREKPAPIRIVFLLNGCNWKGTRALLQSAFSCRGRSHPPRLRRRWGHPYSFVTYRSEASRIENEQNPKRCYRRLALFGRHVRNELDFENLTLKRLYAMLECADLLVNAGGYFYGRAAYSGARPLYERALAMAAALRERYGLRASGG
jgi:hypothetical protein